MKYFLLAVQCAFLCFGAPLTMKLRPRLRSIAIEHVPTVNGTRCSYQTIELTTTEPAIVARELHQFSVLYSLSSCEEDWLVLCHIYKVKPSPGKVTVSCRPTNISDLIDRVNSTQIVQINALSEFRGDIEDGRILRSMHQDVSITSELLKATGPQSGSPETPVQRNQISIATECGSVDIDLADSEVQVGIAVQSGRLTRRDVDWALAFAANVTVTRANCFCEGVQSVIRKRVVIQTTAFPIVVFIEVPVYYKILSKELNLLQFSIPNASYHSKHGRIFSVTKQTDDTIGASALDGNGLSGSLSLTLSAKVRVEFLDQMAHFGVVVEESLRGCAASHTRLFADHGDAPEWAREIVQKDLCPIPSEEFAFTELATVLPSLPNALDSIESTSSLIFSIDRVAVVSAPFARSALAKAGPQYTTAVLAALTPFNKILVAVGNENNDKGASFVSALSSIGLSLDEGDRPTLSNYFNIPLNGVRSLAALLKNDKGAKELYTALSTLGSYERAMKKIYQGFKSNSKAPDPAPFLSAILAFNELDTTAVSALARVLNPYRLYKKIGGEADDVPRELNDIASGTGLSLDSFVPGNLNATLDIIRNLLKLYRKGEAACLAFAHALSASGQQTVVGMVQAVEGLFDVATEGQLASYIMELDQSYSGVIKGQLDAIVGAKASLKALQSLLAKANAIMASTSFSNLLYLTTKLGNLANSLAAKSWTTRPPYQTRQIITEAMNTHFGNKDESSATDEAVDGALSLPDGARAVGFEGESLARVLNEASPGVAARAATPPKCCIVANLGNMAYIATSLQALEAAGGKHKQDRLTALGISTPVGVDPAGLLRGFAPSLLPLLRSSLEAFAAFLAGSTSSNYGLTSIALKRIFANRVVSNEVANRLISLKSFDLSASVAALNNSNNSAALRDLASSLAKVKKYSDRAVGLGTTLRAYYSKTLPSVASAEENRLTATLYKQIGGVRKGLPELSAGLRVAVNKSVSSALLSNDDVSYAINVAVLKGLGLPINNVTFPRPPAPASAVRCCFFGNGLESALMLLLLQRLLRPNAAAPAPAPDNRLLLLLLMRSTNMLSTVVDVYSNSTDQAATVQAVLSTMKTDQQKALIEQLKKVSQAEFQEMANMFKFDPPLYNQLLQIRKQQPAFAKMAAALENSKNQRSVPNDARIQEETDKVYAALGGYKPELYSAVAVLEGLAAARGTTVDLNVLGGTLSLFGGDEPEQTRPGSLLDGNARAKGRAMVEQSNVHRCGRSEMYTPEMCIPESAVVSKACAAPVILREDDGLKYCRSLIGKAVCQPRNIAARLDESVRQYMENRSADGWGISRKLFDLNMLCEVVFQSVRNGSIAVPCLPNCRETMPEEVCRNSVPCMSRAYGVPRGICVRVNDTVCSKRTRNLYIFMDIFSSPDDVWSAVANHSPKGMSMEAVCMEVAPECNSTHASIKGVMLQYSYVPHSRYIDSQRFARFAFAHQKPTDVLGGSHGHRHGHRISKRYSITIYTGLAVAVVLTALVKVLRVRRDRRLEAENTSSLL